MKFGCKLFTKHIINIIWRAPLLARFLKSFELHWKSTRDTNTAGTKISALDQRVCFSTLHRVPDTRSYACSETGNTHGNDLHFRSSQSIDGPIEISLTTLRSHVFLIRATLYSAYVQPEFDHLV